MIRSILFRGKIKGNGIVNFDSKDQRWVLRERFEQDRGYLSHENVKIAKHTFYKMGDKDGKPIWERRLCISSDCLRQSIFNEDFPFQNTMVMHHPDLLMKVIASIPALLRGYFFADEGKAALKRKSPFMITGAEQISNGATHFEINTMSGRKRQKEDADDASDTSMHYEERIGEVEYVFEGALDLKELQFISMSETYDRLAVNPDRSEVYRKILSMALGSEVGQMAYYNMKYAVIRTPEEGILLNQAQIVRLIQELVKRILSLRIQRSKGYAQIASLEAKIVSDPLSDFMADDGGWRAIRSPDELRISPEQIETFYEPVDEQEAKDLFTQVKINQNEQDTKKKEAKAARKQGKKKDAKESTDSKVQERTDIQ